MIQATNINPTQLHLLRLFSVNKTQRSLHELQDALLQYYNQKLDMRLDQMWDEGAISDEKLDEFLQKDVHQWLRDNG